MAAITHFKGILPPQPSDDVCRALSVSAAEAGPDDLIMGALYPLRSQLDAALGRGDQSAALDLAYAALSEVADALSRFDGELTEPWQVRIHALLVELESLPLLPQEDGTLSEQGTSVDVSYRGFAVDRAEAPEWAGALCRRFQSLWPGAWVAVQGCDESGDSMDPTKSAFTSGETWCTATDQE